MVGIINFDTMADLRVEAVSFLADRLKTATADGDRTTLFLSGGSTPGPIYRDLSEQELRWSKIAIAQVDDRWVGLKDPGSNAALLQKTMLRGKAAKSPFVRMKSRHITAFDGQISVEKKYRDLPTKNSVAVLGMGLDGHVCSWFPGAKGLEGALDPSNDNYIQAIMAKRSKVTGPYLERMTLTLSALNRCGSLLLLIKGADKRAVLESAINDPHNKLPVSHLLNAVGKRLTVMSVS